MVYSRVFDMKRKTLLLAISLFSGLLMIYPFIAYSPDILDSWDSISWYSSLHRDIPPELLHAFIKLLINFILQECFYGSIAIWSLYEATGKFVGSPFITKEVKEKLVESAKVKERIIEVKIDDKYVRKLVTIQYLLAGITLVVFFSVFLVSGLDRVLWLIGLIVPITVSAWMEIKVRRFKKHLSVH